MDAVGRVTCSRGGSIVPLEVIDVPEDSFAPTLRLDATPDLTLNGAATVVCGSV
jgi:hypothetical protein